MAPNHRISFGQAQGSWAELGQHVLQPQAVVSRPAAPTASSCAGDVRVGILETRVKQHLLKKRIPQLVTNTVPRNSPDHHAAPNNQRSRSSIPDSAMSRAAQLEFPVCFQVSFTRKENLCVHKQGDAEIGNEEKIPPGQGTTESTLYFTPERIPSWEGRKRRVKHKPAITP